MNNETAFEVGDIVEWCGVEGEVWSKNAGRIQVAFGDEDMGDFMLWDFFSDGRQYDFHKQPSLKKLRGVSDE